MKNISFLLLLLSLSLTCNAVVVHSNSEKINTCSTTENVGYKVMKLVAPHLEYYITGVHENGKSKYYLSLEYDRANETSDSKIVRYPNVKSVPNGKLLIRVSNETVIEKESAYNQTKEYSTDPSIQSVTQEIDGALVTNTSQSKQLHRYTAFYQFELTSEDLDLISKGIKKIRLQSDPVLEISFGKDKMGKKIGKLFEEAQKNLKIAIEKESKEFDEGF